MLLFVVAKNLNWDVLTRIQLLLKDGMESKMKNFNIMWVHWEIHFKGGVGGFMKKLMYWENCLKRGAVCRFKGRGLGKKKGNALYVRFKSLVLTRLSFPTLHCLKWYD